MTGSITLCLVGDVMPGRGCRSSPLPPPAAASRGTGRSPSAGRDHSAPNLSQRTLETIAGRVRAVRRPGDILVASIHWSGNWGYDIAPKETRFAHALIDGAGFDIIHGHSSHHPKAIEIYRDRPILYGCGDFLNDYEGISGYEEFRTDLTVMYLPRLEVATGRLIALRPVPFQIRRFQLHRASRKDAAWLREVLDRESARFAARIEWDEGDSFRALPR